jgi:hypothetical protein
VSQRTGSQIRKMLHAHPRRSSSTGKAPDAEFERTPIEWLDVVETYCRCGLTKDQDKLIAIAGMAQRIRAHTMHKWCAGIWSDQICQGLLWMPELTGLRPPTKSRAPRWSWAAWNGCIQYPVKVRDDLFQPKCELISMQDDASTDTETEWLDNTGRLVVRGKLIELDDMGLGKAEQLGPGPLRRGIICVDTLDMPLIWLQRPVRAHSIHEFDRQEPAGWISFDAFDSSEAVTVDGRLKNCRFLLVGTYAPKTNFSFPPSYFGLYLVQAENTSYKRVGVGQLAHSYIIRYCQPEVLSGLKPHSGSSGISKLESITLV